MNDATLWLKIIQTLQAQGSSVATAESCTGGLIGAGLTSIPGSSRCYRGGIIAYDNRVKIQQLGVSPDDLNRYGAVSEEVVRAMALGVCKALDTNWALATSGIAGPDGGTLEKPVGTVWMAIASPAGCEAFCQIFPGERNEIRNASVHTIVSTFLDRLVSTQNITCSFEH